MIKAETKWKAVIVGSESHVISTADDCHWVIIDGLEVMGGRYDWVKISGDHGTVRNCWIHNNMDMGIGMHNRDGKKRNVKEAIHYVLQLARKETSESMSGVFATSNRNILEQTLRSRDKFP